MAGRGIDIPLLGEAVRTRGVYVIGTNRHESRRIDFSSADGPDGREIPELPFLVFRRDHIMVRYGEDVERLGHTPESVSSRGKISTSGCF